MGPRQRLSGKEKTPSGSSRPSPRAVTPSSEKRRRSIRSNVEVNDSVNKDETKSKSKSKVFSYLSNILFWSMAFCLAISSLNFMAWQMSSKEVSHDEVVDFVPSYAYRRNASDPSWMVDVSAIVYKNDQARFFKKWFLDGIGEIYTYLDNH